MKYFSLTLKNYLKKLSFQDDVLVKVKWEYKSIIKPYLVTRVQETSRLVVMGGAKPYKMGILYYFFSIFLLLFLLKNINEHLLPKFVGYDYINKQKYLRIFNGLHSKIKNDENIINVEFMLLKESHSSICIPFIYPHKIKKNWNALPIRRAKKFHCF